MLHYKQNVLGEGAERRQKTRSNYALQRHKGSKRLVSIADVAVETI